MARSKSIWHDVTACNYNSSKSYGNHNESNETIYVGSSASNSYFQCTVRTRKRFFNHHKYGQVVCFTTFVDGNPLVKTYFKDNNGRAGEFINKHSVFKYKPVVKRCELL